MAKKPNENDVAFIEALAELLSTQNLTEIEVNQLFFQGHHRKNKQSLLSHLFAQALASP